MALGAPSQTAISSAMYRALHLLWDAPPHVFCDTFAYAMVGPEAEARAAAMHDGLSPHAGSAARARFVVRHRIAEDELERAVARGTSQYLVLGAGLDSFVFRRPDLSRRLTVFEVDHPSSQSWKRARLAALSLPEPAGLTFVPVDFEHDDLLACLRSAGFNTRAVSFVAMLGVSQYITARALAETLRLVAQFHSGSAVCLGYVVPEQMWDDPAREFAAVALPRAEALGEPFISFYTPNELEALVLDCGFHTVQHYGPEAEMAYFSGRADGLRPSQLGREVVIAV